MIPALPEADIHLPFEDGPYRLAMGLQAVPEVAWLEIDANYPSQMQARHRLLSEHPAKVLGAEADTEPMRLELLTILAEHLGRHYPDWFTWDGTTVNNKLLGQTWPIAELPDPLAVAGELVQEDFCLIRNDPDGPRLVAAVLCFPSHWTLSEKLGKPLAPIHQPVPFYGERLARPVDRFFATLKPGRIASRLNWTVTSIPDLFQPSGHNSNDRAPLSLDDDLGRKLFMRVERQTFRRLPQSGAVVFGIRVHVTPLEAVVARPEHAARLAGALEALPPEISRYKSMLPFREALLAWLRSKADGKGG